MAFDFVKTGILSERELNNVIQEKEKYKDKAIKAGLAQNDGKETYYDENVRVSNIYFPKPSAAPKTYNILQSLIIQEYAGSNLSVDNLSEFQYVTYPIGGKFKWHSDIINQPDKENRVRGLTFSINISDSDEYEGGNLHVKLYRNKTILLGRQKGSYIIFPSFLLHKVDEIVSGTREALVVWTKLTYKEIEKMKKEYENNVRNNLLQLSRTSE